VILPSVVQTGEISGRGDEGGATVGMTVGVAAAVGVGVGMGGIP
jgi:hypothetical protein